MKQKLETALVLVMGLSAGVANAQVCATQPTCESLGFMQKAADCSGKQLLKCPFDTTKVFCGGSACDSGYIYSSCSTSKGTCEECGGLYKYTSCNDGWNLSSGNCVVSSCSGYSFSSCPSHANCDSCKSGTTIKYKFNSCSSGYKWTGSSCKDMSYCQGRCNYCPSNVEPVWGEFYLGSNGDCHCFTTGYITCDPI